jgi:DNA-binding response OmpR family regulator
MRLLLIEDELTTADLVCESLREAGYEVEHAADGRRGLERALTELRIARYPAWTASPSCKRCVNAAWTCRF